MITGDNPLTACHVASQLKLIDKKNALVLSLEESGWCWKSVASDTDQPLPIGYALEQRKYPKQSKANRHDPRVKSFYKYLCLTGDGFDYLYKEERALLRQIIAEVKVFARVSPKQKEYGEYKI